MPKDGYNKGHKKRDIDADEIKERRKEYMEELYQKDPNELDYYDGVPSQPEPGILETEVKWALGSSAVNKASGCNIIPVELFKILSCGVGEDS